MGAALVPLQNITLGSSTASVTFGSIPGTYRDLRLVVTAQQNTTSDRQATIKPNNDAANASLVYMDGSGSGTGVAGTATNISIYYIAPGPAANSIVQSTTDIFDYGATDKHKTFLTRSGSSYNPVSAYASRWASTTAITSLVIYPNIGGNFSAGSTFALYGVVA